LEKPPVLKIVPKAEVDKTMLKAVVAFKKAGLPLTEPMRVEMRKLAERDPEAFVNLVKEYTAKKVTPIPEEIAKLGQPKLEVIRDGKDLEQMVREEEGVPTKLNEEGFPVPITGEETLKKPLMTEKPIPTKGITEETIDDFITRRLTPEEQIEPVPTDKTVETDKVKVSRPIIKDLERELEKFGFDVNQPEISKLSSLKEISSTFKTIEKLEQQKQSPARDGNLKATYNKLNAYRTGEQLSPEQLKSFGQTGFVLNETMKAREKLLV
jgi:hypothetical protein